jgi:2-keto-4-pentenoate hydratase/2-oxohepta-3-ene-1,7-dioic acid hydratase in catechol pathway
MRIARYILPHPYKGVSQEKFSPDPHYTPQIRWGIVEGELVRDLAEPPFKGINPGNSRRPLSDVELCAPVMPSKVVAVGFNYIGHIEEMGHKTPDEPLLFLKAPSSIIGAGAPIVLPKVSHRVDYEGELAVVIGSRCRGVVKENVKEVVLGYTILNDVTARDLQSKDVQFARAKSFDTFCPLGPWIETDLDPCSLQITTVVNAALRQEANTSTMMFDPCFLVSYVSTFMTLEPGDVIATGTPAGVGQLNPGDEVSIAVEGIGVLTNPVERETV